MASKPLDLRKFEAVTLRTPLLQYTRYVSSCLNWSRDLSRSASGMWLEFGMLDTALYCGVLTSRSLNLGFLAFSAIILMAAFMETLIPYLQLIYKWINSYILYFICQNSFETIIEVNHFLFKLISYFENRLQFIKYCS